MTNLKTIDGKWVLDFSEPIPGEYMKKTIRGKVYTVAKLRRIRATHATKTEAMNHLALLRTKRTMRKMGLEVPEEKKDVLFDAYAEAVLAKQTGLRPNSLAAIRKHLTALLRSSCFKGKVLSAITTAEISRYHAERGVEKPTAANAELWFLKMVLQKAVDEGLLARNPATGVKRYREEKTRLRILTDDEVALLLAAASPRLVPLLRLLLTTGMRPHEAFALYWPFDGWDTDRKLSKAVVALDRKTIFIPRLLAKNHKDREVPLSPELVTMFRGMPKASASGKVFRWKASPKPFTSAVVAAKLKNVTMYTLKHTAASRMIRAGVDIVTVAEILGHSDIKQTIRYCHSDVQSKRDAVAKVSQIYFKDAQVADAPAQTGRDEGRAEGQVS
jgi:integrase